MAPFDSTPSAAPTVMTPKVIRAKIIETLKNRAAERERNPLLALPWEEGYYGLEDLSAAKICALPVCPSFPEIGRQWRTVFAWLGEQMTAAGHQGPVDTVGQVVRGLSDGKPTIQDMAELAHAIGCHCHPVDEVIVAKELRAM